MLLPIVRLAACSSLHGAQCTTPSVAGVLSAACKSSTDMPQRLLTGSLFGPTHLAPRAVLLERDVTWLVSA